MADIRIKDLPETQDVGAEDYVAVDNAGDGTRKFTLRQLVSSVGAPEFVVNVNASGESDKTLADISNAVANGYAPVVVYEDSYYQLTKTTETAVTFTKYDELGTMTSITITSGAVRIDENTLTSDEVANSSDVIGDTVADALDNLAYNVSNFSEDISNIQNDVSDLNARVTTLENEGGGGGGTGLTDDVKAALLQIAQKVAYIDAHGQDYYDDLYDALYSGTTRSVLLVLSHVSSSNTQSTVEVGDSYTTTLTASTNYTINSVTVTMGGVDVTSTTYSSGTVSIPSVTGNIVITATAVLAAQSITATYTQSGTVYDTDSIDSLKADLVVTANYSGGTSETVPASDYTLSGTLAVGTSTITVTYAGLTDTFSVTVSEELLPSTYQQVEYIARLGDHFSSGGPVIDTDVKFTGSGDVRINTEIMLVEGNSHAADNRYIVSASQPSSNNIGLGVGTLENGKTLSTFSGTIVSVYPNNNASIDGIKYNVSAVFSSSGSSITDGTNSNSASFTPRNHVGTNITIFGYKAASSGALSYCFDGRCYGVEIYENDVLICNLIPCYRKSDSVVGMYDSVNNTFLTSNTSIPFTAGGAV